MRTRKHLMLSESDAVVAHPDEISEALERAGAWTERAIEFAAV